MEEASALSGAPAPSKPSEVDSVARRVFELLASYSPCKKGCSACCHMAVSITSGEAKIIGDAYGITPERPAPVTSQQETVQKYVQCRCPFLEQGVCQIYPHRPLACRGFFNFSDFPELCDVVAYPGSDVPSVDLSPLWMTASVVAFRNGEYPADIRDFFPDGLHTVPSL